MTNRAMDWFNQAERDLEQAQELHISERELMSQGIRAFLERQLREVKAEIFGITGRYGVSNVEEMEAWYRDGTLEEAGT